MGTSYEFTCTACGYTADVCAGPDAGMLVSVETMTCHSCAQLVDVVTDRHEWQPSDSSEAVYDGACPECGARDLSRWGVRHGDRSDSAAVLDAADCGPCPKCDAPMRANGVISLWD